ncbi:unnamed protein product [Nyctereutes procyonoides]|uniref:(raccoon dog) hypothetical protein n=1 Tax=Nyctereutes procyonoides TaxID=34880 RepID=A0A811YMX9_NYCPR|nr:unnamed protein product [Nyctereutes procyonoides]
MLTAAQRWFGVLIVVHVIPGCGAPGFTIGWPFYQYLATLLTATTACQLRIRQNRDSSCRGCWSGKTGCVCRGSDMERRACSKRPWWIVSENFYLPLVFYMEEDQEECIFEVHSHTFIQLQRWFTATGQTRVIVGTVFTGLEMLQLVWSQPLTKEDLATTPSMQLFARAACLPGWAGLSL